MSNPFNLVQTNDLIRVGSRHDGGYVTSRNAVQGSTALVSLGINDNWDFERDFGGYSSNISEQILVDNAMSIKWWVLSTLRKIFREDFNFLNLFTEVAKPFKFKAYIKKNHVNFINQTIGIDDSAGEIQLYDILYLVKSDYIYLKIDIERSEYLILEEILRNSSRITGISIEFHDFDLHTDRIMHWIIALNHKGFSLVWRHPNNFGGRGLGGFPRVVEFTFIQNKYLSGSLITNQIDLSTPNNPKSPDISFSFDSI